MIPNPQHKKKSGIYCITNKINGMVYIGQAKDIYKRIQSHKNCFEMRRFKSINHLLYEAYYTFGINNFEYKVLEFVEVYNLKELFLREWFWIEKYKSTESLFGYNLRKDTSEKMVAHDSTRKKISDTIKKQWESGMRDTHSEKLTANWKNNKKRKSLQSGVMSKALTKYKYIINSGNNTIECDYKKLVELGYKNVLAEFHKNKSDSAKYKGALVTRINIKQQL